MADRNNRLDKFLKKKDLFRRNALLIIKKMMELSSRIHSKLVDEVLHSIFFLGSINTPQYLPPDIVTDPNLLNELKGSYPQPFKCFQSKLPKRSPLSCVMDMIVTKAGQQKEDQNLRSLQELICELKKDQAVDLIANTVCVSQPNKNKPDSTRYYGLSMSTAGAIPGRIVVAASCLSLNWDEYVAGAVMTYFPGTEKKPYFNGTIKIPGDVRCQAFNVKDLVTLLPCKSCANCFGFTESGSKVWPYGNCAEDESISNLLKHEKEVKERAAPTDPSATEANRKRAKEEVLKELKGYLKMMKFSWDSTYYTPI